MAASDSLLNARSRISERIAELEARMPRLAPHTISRKMDAIRAMAAEQGLAALEGLADYAAHHALMPGHAAGDPRLHGAYGRSAGQRLPARPRSDPRRAGGPAPLGSDSPSRALSSAMRAFSQLLDDLVYTRSRNSKLRLIGDYLKATPDPDRGLALAALTGTLDIPAVKPAVVRALAEERIDPVLLRMSRDYVGDMAETVSLLWEAPEGELRPRRWHDPPVRRGRAVAVGVEERCAGGAGRHARPSRRRRAVRDPQAGDRRASGRDFGAARQAGAGRRLSGSMSSRSRKCGTG